MSDCMTIAAVSDVTGLPITRIRAALESGALPGVLPGPYSNRGTILRDDVEAWVRKGAPTKKVTAEMDMTTVETINDGETK